MTNFTELEEFVHSKSVSSIETIWTINSVAQFKQIDNGNFTTMDGVDLGVGNDKKAFFAYVEKNVNSGSSLTLFDSNLKNYESPLTVFDIQANGDVYNHGALIIANSSVQGVVDLINTYSTYTQIFSMMDQQIYTVHNYNNEVYDGEGNFVCNNGREGLAHYIYARYHADGFVFQVDDAQFTCDFTGYCVDSLNNDARFTKYFQSIDAARTFKTDNVNVSKVEVIKGNEARTFYWHTDSGNVNIDNDTSDNLFITGVNNIDQLT